MNQRRDQNRSARPRVALHFKLQLISEVKKYPIIWQNSQGRQDQTLLAEAWNQIRTALHTEDVEYCKQQWRCLQRNYRNHSRNRTAINISIARAMAFTRSIRNNAPAGVNRSNPSMQFSELAGSSQTQQAGPSSHTQSSNIVNEAGPSGHTQTTNNFDRPVPTGSARSAPILDEGTNGDLTQDEAVALEVVRLLFRTVPAGDKARLLDRLVQVLITLKPDFKGRVMSKARAELEAGRSFDGIDWSGVEIPVEVCKAIWHLELRSMMFQNNSDRRTTQETP